MLCCRPCLIFCLLLYQAMSESVPMNLARDFECQKPGPPRRNRIGGVMEDYSDVDSLDLFSEMESTTSKDCGSESDDKLAEKGEIVCWWLDRRELTARWLCYPELISAARVYHREMYTRIGTTQKCYRIYWEVLCEHPHQDTSWRIIVSHVFMRELLVGNVGTSPPFIANHHSQDKMLPIPPLWKQVNFFSQSRRAQFTKIRYLKEQHLRLVPVDCETDHMVLRCDRGCFELLHSDGNQKICMDEAALLQNLTAIPPETLSMAKDVPGDFFRVSAGAPVTRLMAKGKGGMNGIQLEPLYLKRLPKSDKIAYPQKDNSHTCMIDAFCSGAHFSGYKKEAKEVKALCESSRLVAGTMKDQEYVRKFDRIVNRVFGRDGMSLCRRKYDPFDASERTDNIVLVRLRKISHCVVFVGDKVVDPASWTVARISPGHLKASLSMERGSPLFFWAKELKNQRSNSK